jgi:streptomycin 6-kinase
MTAGRAGKEEKKLVVEAMRMVHHLRRKPHLQLLAALPERFDSFFESIRILRVSVHMSACAYLVKKLVNTSSCSQ